MPDQNWFEAVAEAEGGWSGSSANDDDDDAALNWKRGSATRHGVLWLLPPSHVDVALFNADRQEIAHQSVPIRLQRRRHSAPGPDRFTVVLNPWPTDAVEILVTPHTGSKHDSVAAN